MSNEKPNDGDDATENGQQNPVSQESRASERRKLEEEVRDISEHIRRVQLESEARILARWKKRGLFGLTTSTG